MRRGIKRSLAVLLAAVMIAGQSPAVLGEEGTDVSVEETQAAAQTLTAESENSQSGEDTPGETLPAADTDTQNGSSGEDSSLGTGTQSDTGSGTETDSAAGSEDNKGSKNESAVSSETDSNTDGQSGSSENESSTDGQSGSSESESSTDGQSGSSESESKTDETGSGSENESNTDTESESGSGSEGESSTDAESESSTGSESESGTDAQEASEVTLTIHTSEIAGTVYTLTSSDTSRENLTRTSDGTGALSADLTIAQGEVWTVTLSQLPAGYVLSGESSLSHTIALDSEGRVLIDGTVVESVEVTYTLEAVSKAFSIAVDTVLDGTEGTRIAGAVYRILDPSGNEAGTVTSLADGAASVNITLTDERYAALAAAEGKTQTWTVSLSETPSYYTLVSPENGVTSFTLTMAEDGTLSTSADALTAAVYTFRAQDELTVEVKDTTDAQLADAQIALVYNGTTIISKKTDGKSALTFGFGGADTALSVQALTAALGLSSEEDLNGIVLQVVQDSVPDGYRQRVSEDSAEVKLAYADGVLTVSSDKLSIVDVKTTAALKITSARESTGKGIKGASYTIEYLNADGTYTALIAGDVLSGATTSEADTDTAEFISAKKTLSVQMQVPDAALELLDASEDKTLQWRVVWKSSPGYVLTSDEAVSFYLGQDADGNLITALTKEEAAAGTASAQAVAAFTYDVTSSGSGKISVTKVNRYNGSTIYFSRARTFYVALFDADGNRVSEPKEMTMEANKTSVTVTFTNLAPGTYYVYEVRPSNYNKIVPTSAQTQGSYSYYASYASSSSGVKDGNVVTLKKTTTKTQRITITNYFSEMPRYSFMAASFYVTKQWNNTADKTVKKPDAFYYKVYTYDAETGTYSAMQASDGSGDRIFSIALSGTSSSATVKLSLRVTADAPSRQLRVIEVNKDGSALKENSKDSSLKMINDVPYNVTYENQDITISADQASIPQVIIKNTVAKVEEDTEDETEDDKNLTASLTLTKKVTYKDAAIRVNAVYYIGIFNDAALTDLRYTKALQFKNASEVSATLKINLYKTSSKEVTFYFAEVDKNGNVVGEGTSSGYEISQNKKSITLNKKNLSDEVIVTNNIKAGSRAETALTSSSSGFAGDSAALAQAQELESLANDSVKSVTGDSSPLLPLLIALGVSAAVLIILVIVVINRRRRKRRRR